MPARIFDSSLGVAQSRTVRAKRNIAEARVRARLDGGWSNTPLQGSLHWSPVLEYPLEWSSTLYTVKSGTLCLGR
jgi:hypothetical protein